MRKWQTVLFLTGILMISQAGMTSAEVLTDGEGVEEAYGEEGLLENEIAEFEYSENQEGITGMSEELNEDVIYEEELCDDLEEVSISGITATITGCYNSAKGGDIRWSKAIGASGYVLYRLRSADGLKKVATINDPNTLQYIDGEIKDNCWGRVYTYYVKPLYGSLEGIKSNEVTLQRLAPMKITKNSSNGPGQVSLSMVCTTASNKALGYEIQYATSTSDLYKQSGSFKKISLNGRNNLSRTISGLSKGQTYYFRVRGYVNYTHSLTGKTTKTWSQYSDVIHVKTQSDTVKVGDTIFFGTYEQDNNNSNGKEKIEWIVLAKNGSNVFITSKYQLDCKEYFTPYYRKITWEECTLRTWLNNDFLNAAFNTEEKNKIVTTNVVNSNNPEYGTPGGNNTKDKIFLLSIDEAKKYFSSDAGRKCEATAYARVNGADNGSWWLRSPGKLGMTVMTIDKNGSFTKHAATAVNYSHAGVRPALWVTL